MLVPPHDGRIDHLHRHIMVGGQCVHDPVPDARPTQANKAIVASGIGTEAADRKTQKLPLRMRVLTGIVELIMRQNSG